MKTLIAALGGVLVLTAAAESIEILPQAFDAGGWSLDVQFMDQMGSPYLLAHGMGLPVSDAKAEVTFPKAGRYRLWVRTRNWADGAPGRFKVLVNGVGEHVFGAGARTWSWEDGGTVEVKTTRATVALRDLTGFEGRCAGVVFTEENGAAPVGALDVRTRPVDETVTADLVVVGAGPAGCAAALAAARRGLSVAIVQDRPVLGGNGSGEIRVGFEGEVRYPIVRELAGLACNQGALADYSDRRRQMLFEREPTLRTCLCNRAFGVEKAGEAIAAVKALDWKRDRIVRYAGRWFCDATGDGWVGFWAGADWRMGRESKAELGETYAPEKADGDTLGASIMWSSSQGNQDVPFSAPWAEPHAQGGAAVAGGWYWEHGIHRDQIAEAEEIRDRLLLAIYGAFSLAKKKPENGRRVLDGVPFLLGKRESRRLLGDWIFSGNDVEKKTFFEDAVVTGSWSIDLHYEDKEPGVDYLTTCRQPHYGRYWIPYRSLYSRNVPNLFMAGRCFSCTHVGLGSPRVMNTLAQMGVVVGEAAALCKETGLSPRGLFAEKKMKELQKRLGGDFPGNVLPERRNWRIVDDETVDLGPAWKKCWQCSGGQCGDKASYTTLPYEKQPKAVYPLPVDAAGDYTIYRQVPWQGWAAPQPPRTHVEIVSGGKTVETSFNPLVGDGDWVKLGTFRLEPGARLVIDPAKSSGNLVADGFAIAPAEGNQ